MFLLYDISINKFTKLKFQGCWGAGFSLLALWLWMQERFGWGRRKSPKGTKILKRPSAVSRSKGEQRTNWLPGGPEGSTRSKYPKESRRANYMEDPKDRNRSCQGLQIPRRPEGRYPKWQRRNFPEGSSVLKLLTYVKLPIDHWVK